MYIINIRIGSTVIPCEESLAYLAGFSAPYANDEERTARDGSHYRQPSKAVAQALSEGLTGEPAVLRAIAIQAEGTVSADTRMQHEAAKLHNAAANAELRAEQIKSARQKRALAE